MRVVSSIALAERSEDGNAIGLVDASERLYRTLFSTAAAFGLATALWGIILAPFNAFQHHHVRSVLLGTALASVWAAVVLLRRELFYRLRRRPLLLLVLAGLSIAVLWSDGGWRSTYYLASYGPLVLAAVVIRLRWNLALGALLATGYVLGLALHGYSWAQLEHLKDADSVVANTGSYLIAATFFSMPVAWLGGFVARINQLLARSATEQVELYPKSRDRTRALSVREVQVAQLVATGLSNDEIARELKISARTVQSHVASALRKTGTSNRTQLGNVAREDGLLS